MFKNFSRQIFSTYKKINSRHTKAVSHSLPRQTVKKEEIIMMTNKNECIACTVSNCAYHAQKENYCTLNKIQVGTHEMNPTKAECTDCQSFVNKAGSPL